MCAIRLDFDYFVRLPWRQKLLRALANGKAQQRKTEAEGEEASHIDVFVKLQRTENPDIVF